MATAELCAWSRGDRGAARELFASYAPIVDRFFSTKLGPSPDLVQATFVALLERPEGFAGRASLRAYVLGIARHVLYAELRRRDRARRFDPMTTSIAALSRSASQRLEQRARHDAVGRALRSLPVEQQTILELAYWEDLTGPEIAEVLGVAPTAVRARLTRARRALSRELDARS